MFRFWLIFLNKHCSQLFMGNLAICDQGFEELVSKDLEDFGAKIIRIEETAVLFEANNLPEISYLHQGIIKLISDVKVFEVSATLDETLKNIVVPEIDEKVKVSCVRKGSHNFKSVDVAEGVPIKNKTYKGAKKEIFIYIKDKKGYIGFDFTGRNLAKRDYKVFTGASTLRGTVAYNLIRHAKVKKNDVILDPFMGSGTIVIEAALYFSKTSPFLFSKEKFLFEKDLEKFDEKRDFSKLEIYGFDYLLKFLKYAQKNAKIADVNKIINLSKVSIDWIDTKMEEGLVDKIITHPPFMQGKKTLQTYSYLFNQAEYLLKPDGEIFLITNDNSAEYIKKYSEKFKLEDEKEVWEGKQKMVILKYGRL